MDNMEIGQDSIGQAEAGQARDPMLPEPELPTQDRILASPLTQPPPSDKAKKALIFIMILALAAISVGAITVSLFGSGQHAWDTGKACLDCHTDIGQEFTDMVGTAGIEPHEGFSCTDCHQNVSADLGDEHAATLPTCTSCHPTVATNMSYDSEAHKDLFTNAAGIAYNKGPNEACIVCHTGFDVSTTFERPDFYNFTIDSTYSITSVETSSSTHTNTYAWTKVGEYHTYIAPANVNCGDGTSGCHNDVIISRGGISGGHQTATQPLNNTHPMNTPCSTCHVSSQQVPDTQYHAAKNITCAFRGSGCHDRGDTHTSTNMTTMFGEINTAAGMTPQMEGDICWGCHSGYNWLDPTTSGTHTWANYTTDLDIPDHGTVAGSEVNTHAAGTENITEISFYDPPVWLNNSAPDSIGIESSPDVSGVAATYTTYNLANLAANDDAYGGADLQDVGIVNDPQNVYMTMDFDYSALGISGSDILEIDYEAEVYLIGGAGRAPINDPWEYSTVYSGTVLIYNWTSASYELIGTPFINAGGDLTIWDETTDTNPENPIVRSRTGGFTDDYMNAGGIVRLAMNMSGVFSGTAFDGCYVVDYVDVDMQYQPPPTESSLEHRWRTVNIPAGADDLTLIVDANYTTGSDDNFNIGYSTVEAGPYTTVITVNSDAMQTYSASLPLMSGQIYLNVIDTNTTDGAQQDTVIIDDIRIMWHNFTLDADSGLHLQVWTEPVNTVNIWNKSSSAFEQVYPRTVSGCADCHDDTGTNTIPFGSGKYIDHLNESVSNYNYGNCTSCHDTTQESWYPHTIPHDISINWTAKAASGDTNVQNSFCDVICHYSDLDSRPAYQDTSTPWMRDIYTSYTNDGALHRTSTLIDADGTVECVDCHPDHLQKPDDGGLSVPGCGDPNLGISGCHVPFQGWANKTDTPSSHGDPWPANLQNCIQSNCHEKHNYTQTPSEGHNPVAQCHGVAGSCAPDTESHPKHINATWNVPEYAYNCSQCHFNANGNQDGWYDTTYGTSEHFDGTVQVRFNNTAPSTIGVGTYGGVLVPAWNSTSLICANTYCHSDANASASPGSFAWNPPDPDWDDPNVVCGSCHETAPTTSSHPKHCDGAPYSFECSECHFNPGGEAGGWYDSTYGTSQHVDGQVQIAFNNTAQGLALHFGDANFPGNWDGVDTCSDIWCHEPGDGTDANALDPTPVWNDPATSFCGAGGGGSCHGDRTQGNRPLSGAHNKHLGNNLPTTSNSPNYNYTCAECHNGGAVGVDTYGTASHVDGNPTLVFDVIASGTIANRPGILGTPSYSPGTSLRTGTCSSVYCHSNGAASEAGDTGPNGSYSPADIGIPANEANVYSDLPWNAGVDSVGCSGQGRTYSCHNGDTLGNAVGDGEYPITGNHGRSSHQPQCWWCHNIERDVDFNGQGQNYQGTYGTGYHVDADLWFDPHSEPLGTFYEGGGDENSYEDGHCGSGRSCWY